MINLLNDAKIDVAITLTEGTVLRTKCSDIGACKDLLEYTPNPLQIIGSYTQSTLNWAVATAKDSCFKSKYDLRNTKVGISRFGSGSHIMAVVFAFQSGWITKEGIGFEFVLLDNIEGLLRGIETGEIDVFLWEMITTKVEFGLIVAL
jgi:sulfonate transport system substrate-binding protein